jgi:hypothetical protein
MSSCDKNVKVHRFLKVCTFQWTYGGLNMETVLALIDATSVDNDQKLQTSIDALDTCSKISNSFPDRNCIIWDLEGVDECDTAARVMECGKNALPDAYDDLVTAVDFTSVVRTLLHYSMVLLNPNSIQIKK